MQVCHVNTTDLTLRGASTCIAAECCASNGWDAYSLLPFRLLLSSKQLSFTYDHGCTSETFVHQI